MNIVVLCYKDEKEVGAVQFSIKENTGLSLEDELKQWTFVYNSRYKCCNAYETIKRNEFFRSRSEGDWEIINYKYDKIKSDALSKIDNLFVYKSLEGADQFIGMSKEERVLFLKRYQDTLNEFSELFL